MKIVYNIFNLKQSYNYNGKQKRNIDIINLIFVPVFRHFPVYLYIAYIGGFRSPFSLKKITWSIAYSLLCIILNAINECFKDSSCDVRSSDRKLCSDDLKAPFVTPEECVNQGCCYDDMFMSEPGVDFFGEKGRTWCFVPKGGEKLNWYFIIYITRWYIVSMLKGLEKMSVELIVISIGSYMFFFIQTCINRKASSIDWI